MTWRTHLVGGLAMLWLLAGLGNNALIWATPFAILGSLLPDLDAADSKIARTTFQGITPLKPLSHLLFRSLGHRGPLHSVAAWLVVTLAGAGLSLLLNPWAGVGLSLGYLSHLLLDACTKSGVPLWWPEPGRIHLLPYRLRVTTGSLAEDGVFALLALAAVALYLSKLPQAVTP